VGAREPLPGTGATYFRSLEEASAYFGLPLPGGLYGVATTCLRVNVTAREGGGTFVLSTVLAPGQGAARNHLPTAGQPQQPQQAPTGGDRGRRGARGSRQEQAPPPAAGQPATTIPYPFTFLEIRENATIL
jgi:hypothetical protein